MGPSHSNFNRSVPIKRVAGAEDFRLLGRKKVVHRPPFERDGEAADWEDLNYNIQDTEKSLLPIYIPNSLMKSHLTPRYAD